VVRDLDEDEEVLASLKLQLELCHGLSGSGWSVGVSPQPAIQDSQPCAISSRAVLSLSLVLSLLLSPVPSLFIHLIRLFSPLSLGRLGRCLSAQTDCVFGRVSPLLAACLQPFHAATLHRSCASGACALNAAHGAFAFSGGDGLDTVQYSSIYEKHSFGRHWAGATGVLLHPPRICVRSMWRLQGGLDG